MSLRLLAGGAWLSLTALELGRDIDSEREAHSAAATGGAPWLSDAKGDVAHACSFSLNPPLQNLALIARARRRRKAN